jgi:hypothetical protein
VEKCHSENPNEWITIVKVNDTRYQMVNAVNLFSKECISGGEACLFSRDFSPYPYHFGVQSVNALFQFGHGNGIKIFADNHVGWLLWGIIKVHGGSPFFKSQFSLPWSFRQPIVKRDGDFGT